MSTQTRESEEAAALVALARTKAKAKAVVADGANTTNHKRKPNGPKARRGKAHAKPRRTTAGQRQRSPEPLNPAHAAGPEPVVRGATLILAGAGRVARLGLRGWLAASALMLLVALSAHAWRRAPSALGPVRLEQVGMRVPRPVLARWVRDFPAYERLMREPDQGLVEAFAASLRQRPAVAAVRRLGVEPRVTGTGQQERVITVDLALRRPVLALALAGGNRAWLAEDGVLLPGSFPGPAEAPLVVGLVDEAARDEVLALWRELGPRIGNRVVRILCRRPLPGGGADGIELVTREGTRLVWGAPGESRYGLSIAEKARNLVHTLECQGDLRQVAMINVRFPEPFAVLPR